MCPLFFITVLHRFGIESVNFLHSSAEISRHHACLIQRTSSVMLFGCRRRTLRFKIIHRFSMGFRSGEFPGHSRIWIPFDFSQSRTDLAVCAGAESCWKIRHLCIVIVIGTLLTRIFLYSTAFTFVPWSTKYREPRPACEKHPHTMTLGECFTVRTVYFGLNRWPIGLRTIVAGAPNWQIDVSSEKRTQDQSSADQFRCFLQNFNRFSRCWLVRSGFLAGWRAASLNSFRSRRRIVRVLACTRVSDMICREE
jgi:hypothetical protein